MNFGSTNLHPPPLQGNDWVSAEDGLPEFDEMVDTWIGKANRRCVFRKPDLFVRHVEPFSNERIYVTHFPDITHWRKLPKPPGESHSASINKEKDERIRQLEYTISVIQNILDGGKTDDTERVSNIRAYLTL